MATPSSGYLQSATGSSKGIMADYQHAARIFVDNAFDLAPRHKFLFYLYIELDPAHPGFAFSQAKAETKVSLLCKKADLPKVGVDTVVKNQYNRKRIVYKNINYTPINVTYHDDNSGVMHALYALYYSYYVKDYNNAVPSYPLGNRLTATGARYGLDALHMTSLFKRISIYTMSRQRFNEYTLFAPRIKEWNHGDVDYEGGGGIIENSMQLEYEGLTYNVGSVSFGNPDGFADLFYDKVPGPLTTSSGSLGTGTRLGIDALDSTASTIDRVLGTASKAKDLLTKISGPDSALNTIKTYQEYTDTSRLTPVPVSLGKPVTAGLVGGVLNAAFPSTAEKSVFNQTLASPARTSNTGTVAPLTWMEKYNIDPVKGIPYFIYEYSYDQGSVVRYDNRTYQALDTINPVQLTIQGVNASNNIVVDSTSGLRAGQSIKFNQSFRNLVGGRVYYISDVGSDTEFSVSDEYQGQPLNINEIKLLTEALVTSVPLNIETWKLVGDVISPSANR